MPKDCDMDDKAFFDLLIKYNELIETTPEKRIPVNELYRAINKCTNTSTDISAENLQVLINITKELVQIINNVVPVDLVLLSGTCLASLLIKIFPPLLVADVLLFITCEVFEPAGYVDINDAYAKELEHLISTYDPEDVYSDNHHISKFFKSCSHLKKVSFPQLTIFNGILTCRRQDLLTLRLKCFDNLPFILSIFDTISHTCKYPADQQFHGFIIMLNWLRNCIQFFQLLYNDDSNQMILYFSPTSKIVSKMLRCLEANLESPINGVPGMIKQVYGLLIELNQMECEKHHIESNFLEFLLEKAMLLSWNMKGKYVMLSAILHHLNYKMFLDQFPEAPAFIIPNLKVGYAASTVLEVYKVIVSNMKDTKTVDDFPGEWSYYWKNPIVELLLDDDRLAIQNSANCMLSWTLKLAPECFKLLIDELEQIENCSFPKVLLLRAAKEAGLPVDKKACMDVIEQNIHDSSTQLRMEVFTLLCFSLKKSEAVSPEEIDLIKEFILANMNVDSSAFHQRILSQLRVLLTRIRDSSVQQYRVAAKDDSSQIDISQLEFVDWLIRLCIKNTFPGACYQRRRFGLCTIDAIYDVFIVSPLGCKKKEKPSGSVKDLIQWAQEKGLLLVFKDDMLSSILSCISDFVEDIRMFSVDIIQKYANWPIDFYSNYFDLDAISLLDYAFSLCNNPDVRNSDSGALLVRLQFVQYYMKNENPQDSYGDEAFSFLEKLLEKLKAQLNEAKKDLLFAAYFLPVHGLILALWYCINNSGDLFQRRMVIHAISFYKFLVNLVSLCEDIISHMLSLIKGYDEDNHCPSFEEIPKALLNMALKQKARDNSDVNGIQLSSECVTHKKDIQPCDVEMLLSFCWNTTKNTSLLLSDFATSIASMSLHVLPMKFIYLQKIAVLLNSCLIGSRHRGVLDVCGMALNKFCRSLTLNTAIYDELTFNLLNQAFHSLDNASNVSVTRRAAGYAVLFQSVISTEPNNINRKLLPYSVKKLLLLTFHPIPSIINDKTDIPQAHAYHILKALVADSGLSNGIFAWLDGIIVSCLYGFSLNYWPVRNAALQLFGVLLPRLCGQKKVQADDSECNFVSAAELFTTHPFLELLIICELRECVAHHAQKKLYPRLVPVLSLVLKLPPQYDDGAWAHKIKPLLLQLLDVPVWSVRNLISTLLAPIVDYNEAVCYIKEMHNGIHASVVNCNKIHTLLLTIQKVLTKCSEISNDVGQLINILSGFYHALHEKVDCHMLHALTLDTILLVIRRAENAEYYAYLTKSINTSKVRMNNQIGLPLIISRMTLLKLVTCCECEVPMLITEHLSSDYCIQEVCLQFLRDKMASWDPSSEKYKVLWSDIFIALIDYIAPGKHHDTLLKTINFMISLCSDDRIGGYILDVSSVALLSEHLSSHLEMKSGISVSALSFTLWSLCIRYSLNEAHQRINLEKWKLIFTTYCHPRSPIVQRKAAAQSVAMVGPSIVDHLKHHLDDDSQWAAYVLIGLCEGSLLLLQDEDEDIRTKTCRFPTAVCHSYTIFRYNCKTKCLQPNIGIKILHQLLFDLLHRKMLYLSYLWNKFQNFPSTAKILLSCNRIKKTDLFEQEYVNVYSEPVQDLLHHQYQLKAVMKQFHEDNIDLWEETLNMFVSDVQLEIQEVEAALEYTGKWFMHEQQVFLVLMKLLCQVKVVKAQNCFLSFDSHLNVCLDDIATRWNSMEKLLPKLLLDFLRAL